MVVRVTATSVKGQILWWWKWPRRALGDERAQPASEDGQELEWS